MNISPTVKLQNYAYRNKGDLTFEKVNDVSVNYKVSPRRNGDVAAIYAKNNLAKEALQWLPKGNTETIMKTAWLWALNKSK